MSKIGKQYSDELKKQIVDLYHAGKSTETFSSEYGVAETTIYNWIRKLSPIQISEDETITIEEYKAAKKRIAQLELENKIF